MGIGEAQGETQTQGQTELPRMTMQQQGARSELSCGFRKSVPQRLKPSSTGDLRHSRALRTETLFHSVFGPLPEAAVCTECAVAAKSRHARMPCPSFDSLFPKTSCAV
jgi:hypothetical protein